MFQEMLSNTDVNVQIFFTKKFLSSGSESKSQFSSAFNNKKRKWTRNIENNYPTCELCQNDHQQSIPLKKGCKIRKKNNGKSLKYYIGNNYGTLPADLDEGRQS
jgi:hypothetical protein